MTDMPPSDRKPHPHPYRVPVIIFIVGVLATAVFMGVTSGDSDVPESSYCDRPNTWVVTAGRGYSEDGTFRAMVEEVDLQTLKSRTFWVTCTE